MELSKFKEEYEKIAKKYKLPAFKELNNDFEIDKLDKENDNILRAIRKVMMEKIVNSMAFLDMLVNPINAPRMYLPYIRTMSIEDKKIIDNLYSALADLSLLSLDLEIDSKEQKEAELINIVFKKWDESKSGFRQILINIKSPKSFNNRKEKSYLG